MKIQCIKEKKNKGTGYALLSVKNKIKNDLEKKIMDEQRMKEEADGKLVDLEQEEIEIMKRIRTTTQVHKACKNFFN